ncbi:MAG: hypothetical protein Q8P49_03815 [Candidatus Liptonbacteria bacterium]|nr:hypothetical protein [Candidatus Liptonbacteria bacterium]
MNKKDGLSYIIFFSLAVLAIFVWYEIFSGKPGASPVLYFLDVGQGDSELMIFPGNVKIMTDAGPDSKVVASLQKVLPAGDRYIDLAIISHPQLDHFNGFNFILGQYRIGAFIINGRSDTKGISQWPELLNKIKAQKIPLITLGAGDRIAYADDEIDILSPDANIVQSGELNDTGFVELIKTPQFKVLLTADVGFNVENYLIGHGFDLRADILKVSHHGSKTSSGGKFLATVRTKIAVIGVGARNTYGHPTKEALMRIASSGAKIFRTDRDGTVKVWFEDEKLKIIKEK